MNIIGDILRPEPKILYLEPVFGCNYRCFFCIHGSGKRIEPVVLGPLLFEKLKTIVESVVHIHITGLGEPFLNPHLPDYLHYFRQTGKSYYINTNGSTIERRHIDLMTTSKSELSVSLDAGDRETYAMVRSGGNWDKVVSTIKKISAIRAERGAAYPLLYLSFNLNQLNLMSLEKIPALAHELGIDGVKFSWTSLPQTHGALSIFKTQAVVGEVLTRVDRQLRRFGIAVTNEAVFGEHVRGCWAFSPMAFVGANATIAACCSSWLAIGSLVENSFMDIWNGMPRRKLALGVLNAKPEEGCSHCRQIRGVNTKEDEDGFFRPADYETKILAEKSKTIGRLPSLAGMDEEFRAGVEALAGRQTYRAVNIFSALEAKFPDFFEIKNNLAAAHFYLGNFEKCKEMLCKIKKIPHNEKIVEANRMVLSRQGR
ncbi:MAG: radical SAM/SPASM domain-containing protein [Syntrophobacteraceae bacterium]|nr:radical SAM/SPASM domain-containing protein [Syntrophobacteraceae bacterium]